MPLQSPPKAKDEAALGALPQEGRGGPVGRSLDGKCLEIGGGGKKLQGAREPPAGPRHGLAISGEEKESSNALSK